MLLIAIRKFLAETGTSRRTEAKQLLHFLLKSYLGICERKVFSNYRRRYLFKDTILFDQSKTLWRNLYYAEGSIRTLWAFFSVFFYKLKTPKQAIETYQIEPEDLKTLIVWWQAENCPIPSFSIPSLSIITAQFPHLEELYVKYKDQLTVFASQLVNKLSFNYLTTLYFDKEDLISELVYEGLISIFWTHTKPEVEKIKIARTGMKSVIIDIARVQCAKVRAVHTWTEETNEFRLTTHNLSQLASKEDDSEFQIASKIIPNRTNFILTLTEKFSPDEYRFLLDIVEGNLPRVIVNEGEESEVDSREDYEKAFRHLPELESYYRVDLVAIREKLSYLFNASESTSKSLIEVEI